MTPTNYFTWTERAVHFATSTQAPELPVFKVYFVRETPPSSVAARRIPCDNPRVLAASTCGMLLSNLQIDIKKAGQMGARGAIIMGFFGAVFAALAMHLQWHVAGAMLVLPFIVFLAIGMAAVQTMRLHGDGIVLSPATKRALVWSSTGEGIGIFIAVNIVANLHRPDLLLPAMALVVGLHFLPIAHAASLRSLYVLGGVLMAFAMIGFLVAAPAGGKIAGIAAAVSLWVAAASAIRRDRHAKRASIAFG